ncbi:hypothetical protein STIAU_7294 [Stigmatella aurantiaca DW4/3-1]|uniref:Uncharacterized protein n=1 Tax=Stigmatella aurantiaca (strain DW4/3-1) TaxID=378806 RepID=Q08NM8_STIAD|nr:hypothetical protein STIAU_7294 [Stigmatella aurantiaca DW4/3-1]
MQHGIADAQRHRRKQSLAGQLVDGLHHLLCRCPSLEIVAVEDLRGQSAIDHASELPHQVANVLHPEGKPLATGWGVNVGGITGQKAPAAAHRRGDSMRGAEGGEYARIGNAQMPRASLVEQALYRFEAELLTLGERPAEPDLSARQGDHHENSSGRHVIVSIFAIEFALHLALGERERPREFRANEIDPQQLADRAVSPIGADQPVGLVRQLGPARAFGVHPDRFLSGDDLGDADWPLDAAAQLLQCRLEQPAGAVLAEHQGAVHHVERQADRPLAAGVVAQRARAVAMLFGLGQHAQLVQNVEHGRPQQDCP